MGILNVTPDSFSDGGNFFDVPHALDRALEMETQGADFVDVGGESTRPGSAAVPEAEELRRVLPVIETMAPKLRIPISIDTYRSKVAEAAIGAGAQIVNDISGLRFDEGMAEVVARTGAGLVAMHSRGARDTLHRQPPMENPLVDVNEELARSLATATARGVRPEQIVLDPGIGFGKDAKASVTVLRNLGVFGRLGYPLLVGASRKSFMRALIEDNPEARRWGTAATSVLAILQGAHILRVHDVREIRWVADLTDAITHGR